MFAMFTVQKSKIYLLINVQFAPVDVMAVGKCVDLIGLKHSGVQCLHSDFFLQKGVTFRTSQYNRERQACSGGQWRRKHRMLLLPQNKICHLPSPFYEKCRYLSTNCNFIVFWSANVVALGEVRFHCRVSRVVVVYVRKIQERFQAGRRDVSVHRVSVRSADGKGKT